MSYLEELLPEFRKGAKIRQEDWDKDTFIRLNKEDNLIYDEKGKLFNVEFCNILSLNDWELYQEPIDWDYIIKNKCLCWFWDETNAFENRAGLLREVKKNASLPFVREGANTTVSYAYCRPVRRDEVTFYEERKDD